MSDFNFDQQELNNNKCKSTGAATQDKQIPSIEPPSSAPPVRSLRDSCLVTDLRVTSNLLRQERNSLPGTPDYLRTVQEGLQPQVRTVVIEWMLDVVRELQCQPEVFTLAVNYFDRFLAQCFVRKSSLQLLGCVCLLLASKFKEACPILGERLIYYSDFSINAQELHVSLVF